MIKPFRLLCGRRWLLPLMAAMLIGSFFGGQSGSAFTTVPLSPTVEGGDGSTPSGGEVTDELPAPDLPTTNEQGYTFTLKVSLKADLESVAREAPVYELRRKKATLKQAQALVDKLAINAEVTDRGDGTFEASGDGQLYFSTELTQYFSPNPGSDGKLPNDDDAIGFGREWLRVTGLLPPDLGDGKVASRIDETKRIIVVFGPAEPSSVLAAYPSVAVTVGPEGVVIEASLRWASVVRTDIYQLLPAEQAWQTVESGQAYIEAKLSKAKLEPGAEVKGRVTYSEISIAYSTSGPPGGKQYLQPIYVFLGKLRIDDVDGSFVVRAYVPALANSGAPVGFTIVAGKA